MGATTQEAGLKLVPNEPTEAMLRRGGQELAMTRQRPWQTVEDDARDCWQAMIGTGRYAYVNDPDIRAAPTPEPMQADMRETIARIEEIATWLESGDPGAEGSVLFSASVAQEHATDLKAILAAVQAESEPVAWRGRDLDAFGDGAWAVCTFKPSCDEVEPLYTHPSPSAPNPDLAGLVEKLVREAVISASVEVPPLYADRVIMRDEITRNTTDALLALLAPALASLK